MSSIGADETIDYTKEDFSNNTGEYDLIFDVVRKQTFTECKDALKPQGIYVTTEFSPKLIIQSLFVSKTGEKKLVPLPMKMLETEKITPLIDRRYPLDEVPEAIHYIGKGHARGKIVITI